MGFSNTSPKGGPVFIDNPPQTVADLNRLREFVEQVGNRVAGLASTRASFTGWDGLEWQDTDGPRDTWVYFDNTWYARRRLGSANGPLFSFNDSSLADISNNGQKQIVRGLTLNSDRVQRVLVSVNYVWWAEANAAGNDEVRHGTVNPQTVANSVSLTGDVRYENDGITSRQPGSFTATAVLQKGTNIITLWASADSAGLLRHFKNHRINVYPL